MSGTTPQFSMAQSFPVLPEPRLDLVGDEQDALPVADLTHALEEAVRRQHYPALALDRLDDHGARRRRLISLSSASRSPSSTCLTPCSSGSNGSLYFLLHVAERAPAVFP